MLASYQVAYHDSDRSIGRFHSMLAATGFRQRITLGGLTPYPAQYSPLNAPGGTTTTRSAIGSHMVRFVWTTKIVVHLRRNV